MAHYYRSVLEWCQYYLNVLDILHFVGSLTEHNDPKGTEWTNWKQVFLSFVGEWKYLFDG
jgi:hypothetical protein